MIVVFGSLSGDHVACVDTLPRPGETQIAHAYTLLPGGKGANQAVAAARTGAQVAMCGCVGDDAAGTLSHRALTDSGVHCEGLRTVARPTGLAFVWVDARGENIITIAPNANAETRAQDVPTTFFSEGHHALVQMEVDVNETWAFVARAHGANMTTVCNLAPERPVPDAAWDTLDWLIVNAHEAAALLGAPGAAPRTHALRQFCAQRRTSLVVTEGADGARAVTPDGAWHVQALDITPVDTTGAGDAFVGAFVARLDARDTVVEALRFASVAGGLSCLSVGAQSAFPNERAVREALSRVSIPSIIT